MAQSRNRPFLAATVAPEVRAEVVTMAARTERSVSSIVDAALKLGLPLLAKADPSVDPKPAA